MNNALAIAAILLSNTALAETLYTVEDNVLVRTDVELQAGQVVATIEVAELGGDVAGLTQEVDGLLFATGGHDHRWLLAIDAHTGKTTPLANLGIEIDALAYDPQADRLYGATTSNWLFSIDRSTGDVQPIGSMGSNEHAVRDLMWVEGTGLVGRWNTSTGDMLGVVSTFDAEVEESAGAMAHLPGTRMLFSADDGVFYETAPGHVRAHRATGGDFNAFMVYTVR